VSNRADGATANTKPEVMHFVNLHSPVPRIKRDFEPESEESSNVAIFHHFLRYRYLRSKSVAQLTLVNDRNKITTTFADTETPKMLVQVPKRNKADCAPKVSITSGHEFDDESSQSTCV
jgi:hypothetical protein